MVDVPSPTLSNDDIAVLQKYREIMSRPDVAAFAKQCAENRSNGSLEGISPGKGGRAWLDGEWQLCELDALCQHIRQHVINESGTPDDFIAWLMECQQERIDEDAVIGLVGLHPIDIGGALVDTGTHLEIDWSKLPKDKSQ